MKADSQSERIAADGVGSERLREICRELGLGLPAPSAVAPRLVLAACRPRLGYLTWHAEPGHSPSRWVARIHDVTDVIFDGTNAHQSFDVDLAASQGHTYVPIPWVERNLLAELGRVGPDGVFVPVVRSNPQWFERDRPARRFDWAGLFVSSSFRHVLPVENVLDAPLYERLNEVLPQLEGRDPLRIAVVDAGLGAHVTTLVRSMGVGLGRLSVDASIFAVETSGAPAADLVAEAQRRSASVFASLLEAHRDHPFDLVHCHEWYSVPAALHAAARGIPLMLSLHSTEYERAGGAPANPSSEAICAWEERGVRAAALVIVPREATRRILMEHYGASPGQATVVPDPDPALEARCVDPTSSRRSLGFDPSWAIALFAGELCYATGADLVLDALPTVCRDVAQAHFVFAGDGPLAGELATRAAGLGLAARCHFLGDVSSEHFATVLLASDFVVIPARTWQDEGLAELALSYGRPVLTTHQANLRSVRHGQNGLVTYDNPGSIVWGVKELLAGPLLASWPHAWARWSRESGPSLDRITVEHLLAYARLRDRRWGAAHV